MRHYLLLGRKTRSEGLFFGIEAAHVIQKRDGEYYVHYLDTDKRMDEWVSEDACRLERDVSEPPTKRRRRGQRSSTPATTNLDKEEEEGPGPKEVVMTEEEYDYQQHQEARQKKNFESIIFHDYKLKPWYVCWFICCWVLSDLCMDRYWSPYPIIDMELPDPSGSDYGFTKVSRGVRSHIRTSDLLMGSLGKHHGVSTLWVCHFCFKYMTDGGMLELHKVCLLCVMDVTFLIRGSENVNSRVLRGRKSTREVPIQYGRSTGQKKR